MDSQVSSSTLNFDPWLLPSPTAVDTRDSASAVDGVDGELGVDVLELAAGQASSVAVPAGGGEDCVAEELLRHPGVDVGIEGSGAGPTFDDGLPVAPELLLQLPDPR